MSLNELVVVNSDSQALTQPAATSVPSPVAEPISAAQAEIALKPGSLTSEQIEKLPVPQFRKVYEQTSRELATVTAERDQLAVELKEAKPLADEISKLGGLPYIKQTVEAVDIYTDIASIPRMPNGDITQLHKDAGQRFVDTIYNISPLSGEAMELVMQSVYIDKIWPNFCLTVAGKADLTVNEVESIKQFVANGFQLQTVSAPSQSNGIPAYCYTIDEISGERVENPEAVAAWRRDQARLKALGDQIESLAKSQKAQADAQKQAEEKTRTRTEGERVEGFRKKIYAPIDEAVKTTFPDAATNPKAKQLRRLLILAADEECETAIKEGVEFAKLGQMGKAEGRLSGIHGKIRVAIAPELASWRSSQGAAPAQEPTTKAKDVALDAEIPFRPERSDYPNDLKGDEKWRYDRAVHRATYKQRFPDEQTYIKQTTRPASAA